MSQLENPPFHARLKDETRVQHVNIEGNPLMKKVFAADVTLGDHVELLNEYYRFVQPLEERAFAFSGWNEKTWIYPPRPRAGLIRDDLLAIGEKTPAMTGEEDSFLPAVSTFAEALGCVYVLEGAAHGAAFLSGRLQKRLKLTPERGLSYYNRYGQNLEVFWHEFRDVLDDVSSDERKGIEIIRSARKTFEQLDRWLKRVGGEGR